MLGRNVALSIARSHVRRAIPQMLELIAAHRLDPGGVISQLCRFDDAPAGIDVHLRRQ